MFKIDHDSTYNILRWSVKETFNGKVILTTCIHSNMVMVNWKQIQENNIPKEGNRRKRPTTKMRRKNKGDTTVFAHTLLVTCSSLQGRENRFNAHPEQTLHTRPMAAASSSRFLRSLPPWLASILRERVSWGQCSVHLPGRGWEETSANSSGRSRTAVVEV